MEEALKAEKENSCMIKRIHLNQHVIRSNKKNNENNPPLTIKMDGNNIRAYSVEINGPSMVVYSPDKPLSCGARLWIETESEIVIN